jgi:hypothetical protein
LAFGDQEEINAVATKGRRPAGTGQDERISQGLVRQLERVSRRSGRCLRDDFEQWVHISDHLIRADTSGSLDPHLRGLDGPDTATLVAAFLAFSVDAVAGPIRDHLAPAFALCGAADVKGKGQVFTPWHLALAMARVTSEFTAEELNQYTVWRPMRIHDPACGSGTMLLASASLLPQPFVEFGCVEFSGQDLDPLCCAMLRINLALFGLRGWVRCANSLTDPPTWANTPDTTPAWARRTGEAREEAVATAAD